MLLSFLLLLRVVRLYFFFLTVFSSVCFVPFCFCFVLFFMSPCISHVLFFFAVEMLIPSRRLQQHETNYVYLPPSLFGDVVLSCHSPSWWCGFLSSSVREVVLVSLFPLGRVLFSLHLVAQISHSLWGRTQRPTCRNA